MQVRNRSFLDRTSDLHPLRIFAPPLCSTETPWCASCSTNSGIAALEYLPVIPRPSPRTRVASLALASFLIALAAAGCGSGSHAGSNGSGKGSTTPPALASIAVTPSVATIAPGATQQFTATGTWSDGSTGDVTSTANWSSSSTSVATVSAAGLATAAAAGITTLTATISGVTGTAMLSVTPAAPTLSSIAITPASPSIAAGATQQFTATGTYSDGTTSNLTASVTWASSSTAAATINAAGLATAVAAGSTTITATDGAISGTTMLTVTAAPPPVITSIAVTPANASIAAGATQQFTATATYNNGTTANITSTATWASSATAVATINASGLATGVAAGSTTISATLTGVTGSTQLTVSASKTLTSIAVTPNPASFATGTTQQFTATATYSDGSTANVTSTATWASSATSVATINASGLATAVATGTTTISVTLNSITGSSSATVTAANPGTTSVTTWHFDNDRSGLNPTETILTPSNVNTTSFAKLFSYQLDGYAYAEPLLMSNVTINGGTHNVLYVATENDSVYAFDADTYGTGAPLWQVSLLQSGETPLAGAPIKPVEGITSTPVIDPSTNTLYVVSVQTSTANGSSFRLHALDITTGAEKFTGPVTLNVKVAASNSDSVGGFETLTTSCIQRAALLLANGNIYMGFGGCHSGWLVAYSASTLQQVGVFNSSTVLNGEGTYASAGGIWMGSGGPVADSSGNVYITTGNGPWNGTNAWGDTVLKFPPTPTAGANGTMQPTDYFTPSIYQYMDCNDADLAAGGLMLIPGTTTLIAGGKTGTMFLVNSSNLGHESANDSGAIQEQVWGAGLTSGSTYQSSCVDSTGTNYANITSYEIFGTSAYFTNYVYLGVTPTSSTAPGGVRQFEYSGTLSPFADASPTINQGTRGTSPFISSDGTSNGIVWMIDEGYPLQNTQNDPSNPGTTEPPTSATLYAYDAASYPNELYDSSQISTDVPGYGIKFTSPIVANGKVYISTGHDLTTATNPKGEIDVYGLK
jgi:uncharacterized protein YjdB